LLLSLKYLTQHLSLSSNKSFCGCHRWRRRKRTITTASHTPRVILCVIRHLKSWTFIRYTFKACLKEYKKNMHTKIQAYRNFIT
jgi:hypothetical protein